MFYQAYGEDTILYHGQSRIPSATGLQQGDPAGPALFSLTIDDLVKMLAAELNTWFLDDGTIGDSPAKILADLDNLLAGFPDLGGELNGDKCELTLLNCTEEQRAEIMHLFQLRLPTIKIIPAGQLDLLGSPLLDTAIPKTLREISTVGKPRCPARADRRSPCTHHTEKLFCPPKADVSAADLSHF